MSKAKKCDRCGGFFDPFHMIGDMCLFRNPVFKNSRNVSEGTVGEYFIPGDPADYLDLCPDCAHKFRLFMHGWDIAYKAYKLEKDEGIWDAFERFRFNSAGDINGEDFMKDYCNKIGHEEEEKEEE